MQTPSLCLVALLHLALAAPARSQTIQTVLLEGDPVPGVGNVTSVGDFAINVHGEWVVAVDTDHANTGADGVVLKNGAVIRREGDAPAQPPGATYFLFLNQRLNANGDVAGIHWLNGVPASSNEAIYWNGKLVLREGTISTAPGFSPGTSYSRFLAMELDSSNRIVLQATVDDPAIPGTQNTATVVLQLDGVGNLISEHVVVKEGDLLPDLAPETVTGIYLGSNRLGASVHGNAMTWVEYSGVTAPNTAVLVDQTVVARKGEPSPVPGRIYSTVGPSLDLSASGQRNVFNAYLGGDTTTARILVRDGAKFVQQGDALAAIAPWEIESFHVAGFETPVCIADGGRVLWYGVWDDPDSSVNRGLFLDHTLLVQHGVTTIEGEVVFVSPSFALSDDGQLVFFEATLADGREGLFRIDVSSLPASYCTGDGFAAPCPCGNTGGAGEGCANSTGAGSVLSATGTASVSAADLVLHGDQLVPSQPGLYFQGSSAVNGGAGVAFGDGLRCAGGSVVRLQVVAASLAGSSQTSVDLGAAGGVAPGDVRRYQLWYRDPLASPCGSQFNLTNGLVATWAP